MADHLYAAGAQQQHLAGEAGIADHDVAAAGQHEDRATLGRGITQGSDRLVRFGGYRQGAGLAPEA
ncbi:hypothetical protein Ato02nite_053890 [Paractinoplanes toevensis]|uniref:Uncharacterized protein n=1 Tax=Paractinoplanes toevensis TaxID=571911 RepID=A0A919TGL1_9ACTN|nr:hypothetical protein Ato02nite_053890 [Actinoplanes toevensis]